MGEHQIDPSKVKEEMKRLKKEAEESGYKINPNEEETSQLVEGLLRNEKRYGYASCPCRLPSGKKEDDLDIICPCDYRDPDLDEYGVCYCGLYVYERTSDMKQGPVPERRPSKEEREKEKETEGRNEQEGRPIWLCKVCGYLCARKQPPALCPVCKVGKERFRIFMG